MIFTLFGLSAILFVLTHAAGNSIILAPYLAGAKTPAQKATITAHMTQVLHLNQPEYIQFIYYLSNLLHGNLGYTQTTIYSGTVISAIEIFFPNTIMLAVASVVISVPIGLYLGKLSGVRKDGTIDQTSRVLTFIGIAMPAFMAAEILILLFGTTIILPKAILPSYTGTFNATLASGVPWIQNGVTNPTHIPLIDALIHGNMPIFWSALRHLVMPVATLVVGLVAVVQRFMRTSLVEVLNLDYIKTARSKGISESGVINTHAMRNSLLPIVTVVGIMLISLLGGVVIVETIFNYLGLGYWLVTAALEFDIGGIIGGALMFGIMLILGNFIIDILYTVIDPRIKLGD